MSPLLLLARRLSVPLATLASACLTSAVAFAQMTPPHVYVTPGTQATTATQITITLGWCFHDGNIEAERHIKLNNQSVAQYFTTNTDDWWLHPECEAGWEQSVGTVPLAPGSNYLNAYILTVDNYMSSGGTATYARPPIRHELRVSAEVGPAGVVVSTPATHRFRIWNSGEAGVTYSITASCTGGATGATCIPSATSRTIPAGQSDTVSVSYTASATAGVIGTVALRAAGSGLSDSAWADVRVVAVRPPVALASTFSGSTIEKDQCLVFSLAADVASECGVLRVTHGMPAVRTVGKSRAPTLVYYADQTLPPRLPVDVTFPSGTTADSVELIVSEDITGYPVIWRRVYAGSAFVALRPMRLNAGLDSLFARGTGLYGLRIQVDRFSGGNRIALASPITGEVAVVNRTASVFGRGWWVAGLEGLALGQPGGRILWIGGDGSTRAYSAAGPNAWVTTSVDRPDTLKLVSGRYVRAYPHGVKVYFDASGRHDETFDRLGHSTRFIYRTENAQALDRIELPPQGSGLSYRFGYDGLWRLTSIMSPGATADRVTTVYPGSVSIDSIIDPDTTKASFRYAASGSWMNRRTDRRGAQIDFTREPGAPTLASSSLTLQSGQVIQHAFRTSNGVGAGPSDAPASVDSTYFRHDGPRTDVADISAFWLNSLGAPIRILNALGRTTAIEHQSVAFPGLATRVRAASGLVTRAAFNARGLPDSVIIEKPLGGTQNAKTTYQWHPVWESPTQTTSPTGVVSLAWYDGATGNVDSAETGGAARRVRIGYNSSGAAKGLVRWLRSPMAPAESVYYDARGNVSRAKSPIGFVSLALADAIGRDTTVYAPIDSATSLDSASVRSTAGWTRLSYDVMNQLTREVSFGPPRTVPTALNGPTRVVPGDSVILEHVYDDEGGRVTTRRKFIKPGTSFFTLLQDDWHIDRAGRVTKHLSPSGADSLEHDPAGNVVRTITARGHSLTSVYDALGRVVRRVVPEVVYASQPCWGFREAGTCSFSFPTVGTQVCIPADTARFAYDATGNLLRADNGSARVRRTYYPSGLIERDSLRVRTYYSSFATACEGPVREGDRPAPVLSDFDQHIYALRMTYDLEGRRTAVTHPSQLQPGSLDQTYGYSPTTGELAWVKDVLGNQVSFAYDSAGRLTTTTFPGAVGDTRGYDADGRLRARNWDQYSRDVRGRVIAATLGTAQQPVGIWYSGLGAVAAASGRTPSSSAGMEEFTTDAIGNRLWQRQDMLHPSGQDRNGERTLDIAGEKLVSIRSVPNPNYTFELAEDYWHDLAGNVDLSFSTIGDGSSVDYDQAKNYYGADGTLRVRNRHTGMWATSNPGGVFEEYRYDALGRRVLVRSRATGPGARYWPTSCAAECLKSYIERTVWDGNQVLYEVRGLAADSVPGYMLEDDYVASTTAQEDRFGRIGYTHALGIDQPVLMARMGLASGTNLILALHTDWQDQFASGTHMNGSGCASPSCPVDWPAARTTVDGDRTGTPASVAWFGNLLTQKTDGSGLQYMRNRYYDPRTGRFTQPDPIGLAGGLNLYGFANGDPVTYSDPFGLSPGCEPPKPCPRAGNPVAELAQRAEAKATEVGGKLGHAIWNSVLALGEKMAPFFANTERTYVVQAGPVVTTWAADASYVDVSITPAIALKAGVQFEYTSPAASRGAALNLGLDVGQGIIAGGSVQVDGTAIVAGSASLSVGIQFPLSNNRVQKATEHIELALPTTKRDQ